MGGFSKHGHTILVGTVYSSTKNTNRTIIDDYMLPLINKKHGNSSSFVLQEDNCGLDRTTFIATYLPNNDVIRMNWLAQSTDQNLIENI